MSDAVQDTLEFEGEPIRQSRLTFKGSVSGPAFRRGEEIAVVATAKVGGVSFDDVKDVATRTQKAPVSKATVIDLDLASDLLDEQHERATGQMKLLSMEGESRRASREVFRARLAVLNADVGAIDDEDSHEDPFAFADDATAAITVLGKLVDEADDYELAEWLQRCHDEFVAAGAALLGGMEWCRRRLAEHHAIEREKAVDAARDAVERAQEAAAVHSDEQADKRERRGVEEGADQGDDA